MCTGSLPKSIFIKKGVVDYEFFTRRWSFKKYVQDSIQDMVYLLEEHFTITEIGRVIAAKYGGIASTYCEYMRYEVWSVPEYVKISTRVGSRAWVIFKYFREIERRLKRRGTNIAAILDKRMDEEII